MMKNLTFKNCVTSKPGAIVVGILLSLLCSLTALGVCHLLQATLPAIPFQAPNGAQMDLAKVANDGLFGYMASVNKWALFLGPLLAAYAVNSLKEVSFGAIRHALLTVFLLTASTVLLAAIFWAVTWLNREAWPLSPHNPIDYYGNTPLAVVDYRLLTTVALIPILMGPASIGLLMTNGWLRRQWRAASAQRFGQPPSE